MQSMGDGASSGSRVCRPCTHYDATSRNFVPRWGGSGWGGNGEGSLAGTAHTLADRSLGRPVEACRHPRHRIKPPFELALITFLILSTQCDAASTIGPAAWLRDRARKAQGSGTTNGLAATTSNLVVRTRGPNRQLNPLPASLPYVVRMQDRVPSSYSFSSIYSSLDDGRLERSQIQSPKSRA
ncbi:hypothetical protein GQ53DRAFT_333313 [Thozetella sp. PMI_491]|nr:hypothetical protein GQ53DRAFT_333313 [Thozetella sp. PMI_491]